MRSCSKPIAADHRRIFTEQGGPILTSRAFAMVSGAMYDANNSVQRIGPLRPPGTRQTSSRRRYGCCSAAHDTLIALYPSQQFAFRQCVESNHEPDRSPLGIRQGRAVGTEVAAMVLAARATDGVDFINDASHSPVDAPGFHQVDPLHPSQGYYAGPVQPRSTHSSSGRSINLPLHDSTMGLRPVAWPFCKAMFYEEAFQEVKRLGGDGVTSPNRSTPNKHDRTILGLRWSPGHRDSASPLQPNRPNDRQTTTQS